MTEEKPPFLCDYTHAGRHYSITVGGDTAREAFDHLKSIGENGQIVGSNVQLIPVNDVTILPVGLWVRFTVWMRNIFR